MRLERVNLLDCETEYGYIPYMDMYILDGPKRPMIVICPGGGYKFTSDRESERIALGYNAAGFHAAVVRYRTIPHLFPCALHDAAQAITVIRENGENWNVDTDKIFVCGFSAGGHLAACISNLWNDEAIFSREEIEAGLHRPNGTILSYPVITSGEYAHKNSFRRILQTEDEDHEWWEKLSMEKRVGMQTPPAFIWHTFEDAVVPVENSLLYAGALRRQGIPFELHIFDKGKHGLSLVSNEVIWSKSRFSREYPWFRMSIDWINHFRVSVEMD